MVKYFEPGELAGGDVQGTPTDVASYRNIYDVARKIIQSCVREQGKLGWAQTGRLCHSTIPCCCILLMITAAHTASTLILASRALTLLLAFRISMVSILTSNDRPR